MPAVGLPQGGAGLNRQTVVSVDYLSRLPAHAVCNEHTLSSTLNVLSLPFLFYIFLYLCLSLQEFQLHVSLLKCECPSSAWSYKLWMTSSLPRSCTMDLLKAPTNTHCDTQQHTVTHTEKAMQTHKLLDNFLVHWGPWEQEEGGCSQRTLHFGLPLLPAWTTRILMIMITVQIIKCFL